MRQIEEKELLQKLQDVNPHWKMGTIDQDIRSYRKRGYFNLLFPLVEQTNVQRAVILMGPRRVGKTVLLQHTIQELLQAKIQTTKILYVSLDTPLFQGLSLERLLTLYKKIHNFNTLEGTFIIFDEIQYHGEWDRHLKALVDENRNTKFIASGSAAAALSRSSKESGAGRFTDFLLPPLTFSEYVDLLDLRSSLFHSKTTGTEPHARPLDIEKLNEEFIKYLNFGGYPEAIYKPEIQKNPERFVRSDIIEKVLLRDLPSLYGIQDIQELTRLFNTLSFQTGNEVTLEDLSQGSGVSKNTIKRYIEYLEAAFLLKTVNRVDYSGKTFRRANYFKVYLTTPSIYSAIFGLVSTESEHIGSLVETAIFDQYMHDPGFFQRLHYARDQRGAEEVDIVGLASNLSIDFVVEVKWSDRAFDRVNEELRGLVRFCERVKLASSVVTTKTKDGSQRVRNVLLQFIPSAMACFIIGEAILKSKSPNKQNVWLPGTDSNRRPAG